jgi:hypothetical protein
MSVTNEATIDLTKADLGQEVVVSKAAGSKTFGNTVIAWNPSATEAAVTVTVTLGGTVIAMKTLTNNDNQLPYNGTSGDDTTKGMLNGSFGADGKTGQLRGSLQWVYQGNAGNYSGFVGAW